MSHTTFSKIYILLELLRKGKIKSLFKGFTNKISSEKTSFVLKRDSNLEHKTPRAFVKLSLRNYKQKDKNYFTKDEENISLIKQLPKCIVAVTDEDVPCYRMWVLDSSQNNKIKEFWGNSYPQLKDDEVLMESAFTTPKFRGLGVMPVAMALIADKVKKEGKRHSITITPTTNVNSIRATNYAGFRPFAVRIEKYSFFKKSVRFEKIPEELMKYYNKVTNNRRQKTKK